MAKDNCLAAILRFVKKLDEAVIDVSELPHSTVSEVAKTDQQCLIKNKPETRLMNESQSCL